MWFFHHPLSGLCVLSGSHELPKILLSYCSVGGGLVAILLPALNFEAYLL
jgi:hypothetical protein